MRQLMLLAAAIFPLVVCEQPVINTINRISSADSTLVLSLEINGNVTNNSAYPQSVDCFSVAYGPDQNGALNQALSFSDTRISSVQIADHPSLDFSCNSFTISLWVQANVAYIEQGDIITKGQAGSEQYCIDIFQNKFRFQVKGSSGEVYCVNSTVVADNCWHKLDAIRDAETDSLFFYCDSIIVGTCRAPEVLVPTSEPLVIGGGGEGVSRFQGSIDQVQVFNTAIRISVPEKNGFVAVSDSVLLLEIDNSVINRSVYAHIINCISVGYCSDRIGAINQALFFNGITASGVRVANHPSLDFSHSSFTISLWVNASIDQLGRTGIVTKGIDGKEQYCIDVYQNRFRFLLRDTIGLAYTVISTTIPDNQWHRIDAVYNALSDSMFLYCDSVLNGKCKAPDVLLSTTEPLAIGDRQDSGGKSTCWFKGSIDQLQVFRKAIAVTVSRPVEQPVIVPTSDTVLLLEIDNSVEDKSVYAHSPELFFITYGQDRNELPNQALSFNSTQSSGVRIADHASLDFQDRSFTISLWVRVATTQSGRSSILSKGNAGTEQYCIDLFQGRFRFWVRGSGGEVHTVSSAVAADNAWHKLQAVRDGRIDSLIFYCDSTLIGKCPAPTLLFGTSGPLVIGVSDAASSEEAFRFNGEIDQVSIYSKAVQIPVTVIRDPLISSGDLVLSLEITNEVVDISKFMQAVDVRSVVYGSDRNGISDGALYFNGIDSSSVRISDHPSLDFSQSGFTISMWLKPSTGQNAKNGIIAKGMVEKEQFSIDIFNYRFRFWVRDEKGNEYVIDSDVAPDFQWHKFEAIYNHDIDSLLLYRDDLLIGKSKAPERLLPTSEPICIGERDAFPGESTYRYKGSIDEVRIYNYPLR